MAGKLIASLISDGTTEKGMGSVLLDPSTFLLQENGFQKFSSGLIIQMGTASLAASTGGTVLQLITFPNPFPNAVFHIFATYRESSGANPDTVFTQDRTRFNFNIGQTAGEAHTVSWLAIGW